MIGLQENKPINESFRTHALALPHPIFFLCLLETSKHPLVLSLVSPPDSITCPLDPLPGVAIAPSLFSSFNPPVHTARDTLLQQNFAHSPSLFCCLASYNDPLQDILSPPAEKQYGLTETTKFGDCQSCISVSSSVK